MRRCLRIGSPRAPALVHRVLRPFPSDDVAVRMRVKVVVHTAVTVRWIRPGPQHCGVSSALSAARGRRRDRPARGHARTERSGFSASGRDGLAVGRDLFDLPRTGPARHRQHSPRCRSGASAVSVALETLMCASLSNEATKHRSYATGSREDVFNFGCVNAHLALGHRSSN